MALKTSTIALISTAVVASFGLGFLIYYDNKRRSDPQFKKQLSKFKTLNKISINIFNQKNYRTRA